MFSRNVHNAYSHKIDVMTVTPDATKSGMNSGRATFAILAEPQVKATVDQLGWWNETRGHYVHAIQPYILSTPLIGGFIRRRDDAIKAKARGVAK